MGYLLYRVRRISALLPEAKIEIYTNGDFLDKEGVASMAEAGVKHIQATAHGSNNKNKFRNLSIELDRRLKRLGMPYRYVVDDADLGLRIAHIDTGRDLTIYYFAHDFYRRDSGGVLWASDRGQSLDVNKNYFRHQPCFIPFVEMQVEWDGRMLPCCQINPDAFSKDDYVLGSIRQDTDIFLEWTNSRHAAWRQHSFDTKQDSAPCSTCNFALMKWDATDLEKYIRHYRDLFDLDSDPRP